MLDTVDGEKPEHGTTLKEGLLFRITQRMNQSSNDKQLIRAPREEGTTSSGNTGKGTVDLPGEWTEAWLVEDVVWVQP